LLKPLFDLIKNWKADNPIFMAIGQQRYQDIYGRHWKLFYTIKFSICYMFNLYGDPEIHDAYDFINVAYGPVQSVWSDCCMDAKEWEFWAVYPGIFRDWVYSSGNDGNC